MNGLFLLRLFISFITESGNFSGRPNSLMDKYENKSDLSVFPYVFFILLNKRSLFLFFIGISSSIIWFSCKIGILVIYKINWVIKKTICWVNKYFVFPEI